MRRELGLCLHTLPSSRVRAAGCIWKPSYTAFMALLPLLIAGMVGCAGVTSSTPKTANLAPASAASVSISPSALAFGSQAVATASTPQTLTITNTGSAQATIQSISSSNSAFTYSGATLPATVAPSGSLQLAVAFDPSAPSSVSGQLLISGTASNLPANVGLSGSGTAAVISITPATVDFGSQTQNTTSGSQSVQLSNIGNSPLSVTAVSVSPAQFAFTGPAPPFTILPNDKVAFNVTFTPATVQSYSGALRITSDAYSGGSSASLLGSGVATTSVLKASPTSLNFNNQLVNVTSPVQIVSVANGGSTSITLNQVSVSKPVFSVTGFSGSATLAAGGQPLLLSVTYTPTTATGTADNANLTISGVSSDGTAVNVPVSLSGTGVLQSTGPLTPPNCGLSGDATNHVPADSAWSSFTPPALGGTYKDALYGCTVKRLTNNVGAGQNALSVPFYSTVGAFSANESYLLVYGADSGGWGITDLNGNVVVSQSTMSAALARNHSQWRWDRVNDNVIWNTAGNVLYACTINATAHSLSCAAKHTFSEYPSSVVFPGDSDVNPNGWAPMVGQATNGSNADLFLYNLTTLTKSAVAYTTICTGGANSTQPLNNCIHRMIATPNNGFTIEWGGSSGIEAGGQYVWEPGFPIMKAIQSQTNHHDVGLDLNGNEVAAYETDNGLFNANGGSPISPCTSTWNPVTVLLSATMLNNQASSCLFDVVPQKFNGGSWHVSFLDSPSRPWIVYSQQGTNNAERWNNDGSYQNPSTSGWARYDNEILMVRVDANGDPSKVYRLALSHSRELESYFAEPHAVISRSGKYIAFGSNAAWGATGCGGDSPDNFCNDVYLIGPLF